MAARRLGAAGGALWGLPGPYDKRRGRCPRALVSMNNSCPRGSAWVCRPCACRCCSLALPWSPAQRAPHEREEPIPLPLVLGDLGSTPPVRQHCPKSGLQDRLNKHRHRLGRSVFTRLAHLFVARPLSTNALLYSTSAAATIRCATRTSTKTRSLTSESCCFTRRRTTWPVALEQRFS